MAAAISNSLSEQEVDNAANAATMRVNQLNKRFYERYSTWSSVEAFNDGNLSMYDVSPGSLATTTPSPSLSMDGDEYGEGSAGGGGKSFSMGLGAMSVGGSTMFKRFSLRSSSAGSEQGAGTAPSALQKLRSQAKQNMDSIESRVRETRERMVGVMRTDSGAGSSSGGGGGGSSSGSQWDEVDRAIMKHSQIPGLRLEVSALVVVNGSTDREGWRYGTRATP